EDALEVGVRVVGRLLAIATAQIGVDHVALDRAGADDGDLDDEVVEGARAQPREHRHLGPALDLEHADGVGLAQHVVGGGVLGGDGGHAEVAAVVGAHEVEGAADLAEGAEAEQVDLEQAEVLDVVFVPLDDGAPDHGGGLDRAQAVHRVMSQQEAAGVGGGVAGEAEQLAAEADQVGVEGDLEVDTGGPQHVGVERAAPAALQLGGAVEQVLGGAEGLADVAQGGARAVADEGRDHGGVAAAVALIDVLDDLFAALVLDVEVDVRGLGALAADE